MAARLEALLDRLDESADEATRTVATEALEASTALYGEALARLAEHVAPDVLVRDDVIAHVLLLHGLHPVDVPTRITHALEALQPALEPHGARAQLPEVGNGVARVRMRGGHGCGAMAVRRANEDAVKHSAPELDGVEIKAPRRAGTAA